MAGLTLPILPIPSQTGAPDLPILPTPPMGGGRNGKQETMAAELFGPEQVPPLTRERKEAAARAFMARGCCGVRRELKDLEARA